MKNAVTRSEGTANSAMWCRTVGWTCFPACSNVVAKIMTRRANALRRVLVVLRVRTFPGDYSNVCIYLPSAC